MIYLSQCWSNRSIVDIYIRRESDVEEWESKDWQIKRAHEFYAEPLAQFRLTLAQKVLLMYNNTGIRRHSCISMMSADIVYG